MLVRFEAQLRNRPADVLISRSSIDQTAHQAGGLPSLTNVRNFSGPDSQSRCDRSFGRGTLRRATRRHRLSIQLDSAVVSSSL